MARIRVTHTIDDLADDCRTIAVEGKAAMSHTVQRNAHLGNGLAKAYAKVSAGAHGVHYHKAFSAEAITALAWEYGPDSGMPQGGMSFEYGSRNSPPHLDLARSADIVATKFAGDVGDAVQGLFWP